jgi:hemolysin activation/secretion protein
MVALCGTSSVQALAEVDLGDPIELSSVHTAARSGIGDLDRDEVGDLSSSFFKGEPFRLRPFTLAQQPLTPPPPSLEPLPEERLPDPLPPLEELLTPPPEAVDDRPIDDLAQPEGDRPVPEIEPDIRPDRIPDTIPDTIIVQGFDVVGSTVFSDAELEAVTAPFTNRPLSFPELLQARSAVTQLYIDAGYITSGAYIPPQTLEDGRVQIQVIEGEVAEINIFGNQRLRSRYIRSRVAIATTPPLNINDLLNGLQLLQLNPLIDTLSAELSAGVRPGTSMLDITVQEAASFWAIANLNNRRSPSVGSVQQELELGQANLLGFGDSLSLGYARTDGSEQFNGSYAIPLNPRNGTLSLSVGFTEGEVIEPPFTRLEIEATSSYYELGFRQPLHQSPSQEFALGLVLSHQRSRTLFGILDRQPLPLPGTDEQGRTRVTALRFYQDWINQGTTHVLAARSQLSVGLDALGATVLDTEPDARFVAWRGQGQWVQLLAPETLLLVRTDLQLTPDPLVSLEQFGLGGQRSIRGYRQDYLLVDNGVLASAEVRVPVLRIPEVHGLLQVAPFIDFGWGWNVQDPQPVDSILAAVGLGLLWQQSDYLSARLDFGLPLIAVDDRDRTLQENGIYFSLTFSPRW